MKIRHVLFVAFVLSLALPVQAQTKKCEELRDQIASRLAWPKGSFRLEVVDKDEVGAGKTLGSCEGGARRVVVYLGVAPAAAAAAAAEATSARAIARPTATATDAPVAARVAAALQKPGTGAAPAATPSPAPAPTAATTPANPPAAVAPAPAPAPAPVESKPVASVAPESTPPAAAASGSTAAADNAPPAVAAPAAVVSAALAASSPVGLDPREALLGSRIDTHVKVDYPASLNVEDKSARITLTFDSDEAVQALGVLLARIGKTTATPGATTALIDAEVSNASDGLKAFTPEPKTKLALPGLPTTWSWTLLPKDVGKHSLDIVLTANLPNAPPTVLTRIVKQVDVERTFAQSASEFFAKYWQWLSTTILLPLFGWFWKSRGRAEAKSA